jgi:hypothetical protein
MTAHKDAIWNKVITLNVSLFAWRMLEDKFPLKDNLIRRGMHLENSTLCVGGCDVGEIIELLVVGCNMSLSIWIKILYWLGIFGPLQNVVVDHFTYFVILISLLKR